MEVKLRKLIAAAVLEIGLLTFFMPFVTTDAPVHGRNVWSPLDLAAARADQWRPAPPPFHRQDILYEIGLVYLLMGLGLPMLLFRALKKPLVCVAIIGAATSISLIKSAPKDFGWLFYGRVTHSRIMKGDPFGWEGLQFDSGYLVFLSVMPLFVVTIMPRRRRAPSGTAEGEEDQASSAGGEA